MDDLCFEFFRVMISRMEFIVEFPPYHSLHLSAIVRKNDFRPVYNILEVEPEFVRIRIVLVLGHVSLNLTATFPVDRSLEVVLSDR